MTMIFPHRFFVSLVYIAGGLQLLPSTCYGQSPSDPCYVCRSPDRYIIDLETQFDVEVNGSTAKWTCGHLDLAGQDYVTVGNAVCGIFYALAEAHCECGGPPIPPPMIIDTSPACDICDGMGVGFVPDPMIEELVDTGIAGEMPCGFLYQSAADGFLPGSFCPTLRQNVGSVCCNIPKLPCTPGVDCSDEGNNGDTSPPVASPVDPPNCQGILDSCDTDDDCCEPFVCSYSRVLGDGDDDRVCSAPRIRQRPSIIGDGRGGAAGRAKTGF